jgi:L-ribulose-5-phosphate 4-epimerase
MLDEGYIKYQSDWTEGPAPDAAAAGLLDQWRRPLFAAGLVGYYVELGVGFGNISMRCGQAGQFLITGTQTGRLEITTQEHYSLVTEYDIDRNRVSCTGPSQASSEALTHAAIYELDPSITAIVHIHSAALWNQYLDSLPTTRSEVAYGTPEMAREFRRLYADSSFSSVGIAVMGGHEEGLIGIGESLEQAATRILLLENKRST